MRFEYEEIVKHTDINGVETIVMFLWYKPDFNEGRELAIVAPLDIEFQIDNRVIEQQKRLGKSSSYLTFFADSLDKFERVGGE